MRIITVVAGLSAVVLAGCASQPSPVVTPASQVSIRDFAGSWEGTYTSKAGRQGRMLLTMRALGDSAVGEVLMAQPGARALRPDDAPAFHKLHASSPNMLAVTFKPAGGEVIGALEPFVPSDCDCTATTILTARASGDTLWGTFETRGETMKDQVGKWRAQRKVVMVGDNPGKR